MGTIPITIEPNENTEPKVYKYQFYVNGNPCAGKIVTITQEGKEPEPEACGCETLERINTVPNLDSSGGTNVLIGTLVGNLEGGTWRKCDSNDRITFTSEDNWLTNINLVNNREVRANVAANDDVERNDNVTLLYNGNPCADSQALTFLVTQKETTSCTCNDISISLSGNPFIIGDRCLGWEGPERMSAYTIGSLDGEVSLCDGDELGSLEFVSSEDFVNDIHLEGNVIIANVNQNTTPTRRTTTIGVRYKGEVCQGEGKSFVINQCAGSSISKVINVDLHCNAGIDVFGTTSLGANGIHMYLERGTTRYDVILNYDTSSDAENTLQINHGCNDELLTEKVVTGISLGAINDNKSYSLHFDVDNLIVCGESPSVSQNSALYIKNTGYKAETCDVGISGNEQYAHWVIEGFNPSNGFNDMQFNIRGSQQQAKPFGWDCNCRTNFEGSDTYVVDASGATIQIPYTTECEDIEALQLTFYPLENSGGCSVNIDKETTSSGTVTVTIGENTNFIGRDINLSINTYGEGEEIEGLPPIRGVCQYKFTFIQKGGDVVSNSSDDTDGDNTESPEDTENQAKQGFFDPDLDLMDNPVNPWK